MPVTSPFEGIDRDRLIHPSSAIAAFVKLVAGRRNFDREEKRGKTRRAIALPIIVQPMNPELLAAGAAFRALTRDISTEGIGFVHTEPIKAPFVAVEIENPNQPDKPKMQVLVELRRCQKIHDRLFHIGGKFVLRFDPDAQ